MENVNDNPTWHMQGEFVGQKNKKEHMIENKEYIICLPYEVLLCIFSLLPLEALILSSLVSKRWESIVRNLLSIKPSSINLDENEMISKIVGANTNVLQNNQIDFPSTHALFREHSITTGIKKFIQFVDRTLHLHKGCTIKKLCFNLCSDENHISQKKIDDWYHFALTNEVKELELNFLGESFMEGDSRRTAYELPHTQCVSKSLKCVKLNFCNIQISNLEAFSSLQSLFLNFVMVLNFSIKDLITKCPMLEELRLERCIIPLNFMICKEHIMIKSLTLVRCWTDNWPVWPIDISAPKMSDFTLEELCLVERTIIKAPNIGDVVITIHRQQTDLAQCETWVKLLHRLSHCRTLSLNSWCIQVLSYGPHFLPQLPILFNNLKHLKLKVGLKKQELPGIAYMLRNSHYMETLTLDFNESIEIHWGDLQGEIPVMFEFDNDHYWESQVSSFHCLNYSLKEVKVHGISGRNCELKMLKFLLENAKVLEDMSLWISRENLGNLILTYLSACEKASPQSIISLKI